jgi:hypothetical protein
MMSEKAKAAAKQFLSVLTPLFGEADRPLIEEKLGGNEAALIKLGEGVLRQEDYSSKMAEATALDARAKAWHTQLDAWNAAALADLKAAGFEGVDLKTAIAAVKTRIAALKQTPAPSGGDPVDLTEERVAQIVAEAVAKVQPAPVTLPVGVTAERINEAMALAAALPKLAVSYMKKFGKELDTEALVAHARATGKPIDQGGYEDFIKADQAAFDKATRDKELLDAEARGAAKARAELSGAPPWPTSEASPGGAPGPVTTLSGLTHKDKDGKPAGGNSGGVTAAVELYNQLTAARGGTPS